MSSLTDITDAILSPIRQAAAEVANDGRDGRSIIFTARPSPDTQRPYGLLQAIGEPDAGLPGEEVTQLQLSIWGAYWKLSEISDALAWLDGHRVAEFGGLRGLRYRRLSRNLTADPDAEGVFQMADLYEGRYLSIPRMGVLM